MLQDFTRPELKRNHFTETNLPRFPHHLAAWGQELPTLVPLLRLTQENETSGVETHKYKLPQEPVPG